MRHQRDELQDGTSRFHPWERELRQSCRNLVKLMPRLQGPNDTPEAEPQGNAMLSVRVAAAGVVVASLCCVTAPAGACDFDRNQKKCDRELAARAEADSAAERKSVKRVKTASSRRAKHVRTVKGRHAPRFAVQREGGMTLASSSAHMITSLPESVLARRFRGFIDPRPVADNSFEALRKPHLVSLDFDAAAIAAPTATAEAMSEPSPGVASAPKQDKIAGRPMELASAESKPVTLAPAQPVEPAPAQPATVQASLTASPPADDTPSRFPIHSLVLALCGALGAASALRFIVGA
jgi:hypothetical protein